MTPVAAVAMVMLALAVRLLAAAPITFPALDDPAFYLTVARNIAAGRGLVIAAVWSYQLPFASVTHPSNEYWMPLTSLVFAPFVWVFGPDLRVAQAMGCGLGALLPLPAMWAAGTLTEGQLRRPAMLIAGVLTALNPLLVYQAIVPDSSIIFALTGGAALLLSGSKRLQPAGASGVWLPLAAGLAAGLAYLSRADGLFLMPLVIAFIWLRCRSTRAIASVVAGFLLAAGPWWVRQTLTFGSPIPVAGLVPALVPDYATLFSWPSPTAAQLLSEVGPMRLLTLRVEGLSHNILAVLLPVLGALSLPLVLGLRRAWQHESIRPALAGTAVLLLASALLFPVAAMHGTFYHSLGAPLPVLIGIGSAGLAHGAQWWDAHRGWKHSILLPLAAGLIALTGAQTLSHLRQAAALHDHWQRQFAAAGAWLGERPTATVMTTQPYTLHYATGVAAVMLPPGQPPDVALDVARRYDVRYLVLTERTGLYPNALDAQPTGFELAFDGQGIRIYEVTPP